MQRSGSPLGEAGTKRLIDTRLIEYRTRETDS
jgi:hypothetical protein